MEHKLCLNPNSFPADSHELAYQLFNDSWQGALALNQNKDRYILYLDTTEGYELQNFPLAPDFTYSDFMAQLLVESEIDLYYFLIELEDKSPAMDHFEYEMLEEIDAHRFYTPGFPIPEQQTTLSLAHFLDATLLSISTTLQWEVHELEIVRYTEDYQYNDENLTLRHIANQTHGELLFEQHYQTKKPADYTVDEIWEEKDDLYPYLRFLGRIKDDLVKLKKAGLPYRRALGQLDALNNDIERWVIAGVDQGEPEYSVDSARGEHDNRRELTTWRDESDELEYYFDKHLYIDKFGFVGRLHFRICPHEQRAIIAYAGRKLGS